MSEPNGEAMSGENLRYPILRGKDIVKIVDDREQVDVVNCFPTLQPGDVLKITSVDDLGEVDLGQLIAVRQVEHESALFVDLGSKAEDAVRTAGVVGARVTHIDER